MPCTGLRAGPLPIWAPGHYFVEHRSSICQHATLQCKSCVLIPLQVPAGHGVMAQGGGARTHPQPSRHAAQGGSVPLGGTTHFAGKGVGPMMALLILWARSPRIPHHCREGVAGTPGTMVRGGAGALWRGSSRHMAPTGPRCSSRGDCSTLQASKFWGRSESEEESSEEEETTSSEEETSSEESSSDESSSGSSSDDSSKPKKGGASRWVAAWARGMA